MAKNKTTATLNGRPLILSAPQRWTMTTGVTPFIGTFDIAAGDAEGLISDKISEDVLELHGQTWEQLSILWIDPGSNPHERRVRVADRRYWWPREHLKKSFNIPRRVALERRNKWGDKLQVDPSPIHDYKHFSLRNGKPWSPEDALRYVLNRVERRGVLTPVAPGSIKIQDDALLFDIPIENVRIDANGRDAVSQILAKLQGAAITIDPDGSIRVFSWLSEAEEGVLGDGSLQVFGALGAPVWDQGNAEHVDLAKIRPAVIDVLFTPEIEMRFDFVSDELPKAEESKDAEPPGMPARILDNVGPTVDFELTVGKEKVAPGTFKTIKEQVDAWNLEGGIGLLLAKGKGLTFDLIDQGFIPERGLWAIMDNIGTIQPSSVKQNWMARTSMLMRWYRQGFRLPKAFVDNAEAIRPYLVATLDRVSGQRAPAMAYADHCIKSRNKGLLRGASHADTTAWAMNVAGYPGANTEITKDSQPSPARVVVTDQDMGIIRLDYLLSPFGNDVMVFPAQILNVPTGDLRASNSRPVFFNSRTRLDRLNPPKLGPSKVAVILTMIPADKLFTVSISASDHGITATGPRLRIRVRASVETARFAWSEQHKGVLTDAFDPAVFGLSSLKVACVNLGDGEKDAASLKRIALAHAKAIWARDASRLMGSKVGDMNSAHVPVGSIQSVTHTVNPDGSALSAVACQPQRPLIDMTAFLDAGTQRIVLRAVK